ncbi:hypothetical protein NIIDMKKI_57390 [Mycobacterium kansasii]|uniref:3'-phosphate/5'-hydroxy nucleic acid ligase n=1 Tax=Mycobacterium kansasii TaxID=1768 RepID=A0A7G1IKT7_MYCKA|nr:hypothetical protein NIIDMKKI_57390 [Mycobacterium kansasii]
MPQRLGPKLLNFASEIDDNTLEQAKLTASMPFVHPHVSLMPDAHLGKGSAVGTVIPTKGAVIPAAVGVDIGCGMVAAKTRFTEADLAARFDGEYAQELPTLRRLVEDAIPLSPGNYNKSLQRFPFTAKKHNELLELQAELDVDLSHSPKWMQQLGSLGGGNHFIELCVDLANTVWLFLHSGSRGVGNKIAQRHINIALQQCSGDPLTKLPNRDLAFLNEGTPEFDCYIRDLKWAQRFAYLNRAEMMDRFIHVFASWLGVQPQRVETERINCHHNYTAPTRIDGETVWLTRKGAIDATEGKLGVIPDPWVPARMSCAARETTTAYGRPRTGPVAGSAGPRRSNCSPSGIWQWRWWASNTAMVKSGSTRSHRPTRTSTASWPMPNRSSTS